MTVEVDTQTLGHIVIQYSALLSFLGFVIYEGLLRRRLGRPLSILWTLICAGQLIKCSCKYVALEAWDTISPQAQSIIGHIFAVDGIFMASCFYGMTMLYYFAAKRGDYARFKRRGLRIYVPALALLMFAGMLAFKTTGMRLEHFGNLILIVSLYVHFGTFYGVGRSAGWFAEPAHRVAAAVSAVLLLTFIVGFAAVANDFHAPLVLTMSLLPVALNYITYSVSVRALAQLPALRGDASQRA